jgi:hypothetical protein
MHLNTKNHLAFLIIMKIALVTTCTNRKKVAIPNELRAANLPRGDQHTLLQLWTKQINLEHQTGQACDLYCGRGFSEALATARNCKIGLWIISAGLGLVASKQKIPPYNLTITTGYPDSLQTKLVSDAIFYASGWWTDVNSVLHGTATPIADLVRSNRNTIFVLALSSNYAELIADDLNSLENDAVNRVRILGCALTPNLSSKFRDVWMPYDDRFDGPDSCLPGTRSDFPQRIARHFIEEIVPRIPTASPQEHANKIISFLKKKRYPSIPTRTLKTDAEIKFVIDKRWQDCNGLSGKMLRILRDDELIACEQKRFSQLFNEVKARKNEKI